MWRGLSLVVIKDNTQMSDWGVNSGGHSLLFVVVLGSGKDSPAACDLAGQTSQVDDGYTKGVGGHLNPPESLAEPGSSHDLHSSGKIHRCPWRFSFK